MKSDYDTCIAAGCDGFLTKPISKEKLFQVIYKYLEIEGGVIQDVFEKRSAKMQELIIKFVKGLPEKLDEIEKFRNENKWKDVCSELHKIKGIGTSMGYPMVTDIAAEIEQEAIKENEVEVDKLFLKMKEICEQAGKNIPELTSEHKE
jgi:HPt (histidine-containing phosphotransfer) domain-containing protein